MEIDSLLAKSKVGYLAIDSCNYSGQEDCYCTPADQHDLNLLEGYKL